LWIHSFGFMFRFPFDLCAIDFLCFWFVIHSKLNVLADWYKPAEFLNVNFEKETIACACDYLWIRFWEKGFFS
jgi:hypothetical protein